MIYCVELEKSIDYEHLLTYHSVNPLPYDLTTSRIYEMCDGDSCTIFSSVYHYYLDYDRYLCLFMTHWTIIINYVFRYK